MPGKELEELRKDAKKPLVKMVSIAVFSPTGQLLIGHRKVDGLWTTPGGHIEEGEAPLQAALRELREETGISCTPSDLQYLGEHDLHHPHQRKMIYCYKLGLTTDVVPTTENDPDDELSEWVWANPHLTPSAEKLAKIYPPRVPLLKAIGLLPGGEARASRKDDISINNDTLEQRSEDKYFVSREYADSLKELLRAYLDAGDPNTSHRFNLNQTTYLDNPEMMILYDYLDSAKPRYKIRIRQYAPDGEYFESVAYLEMKIKKEDGTSQKLRFRVSSAMIRGICEGKCPELSVDLKRLNPELSADRLCTILTLVQAAIEKHELRQQNTVLYERWAFTGKNIRITIDDKLGFYGSRPIVADIADEIQDAKNWEKIEDRLEKYRKHGFLIMEVKYRGGEIPEWVAEMLEAVEAERVKFSKYGMAVAASLLDKTSSGPVGSEWIGNAEVDRSVKLDPYLADHLKIVRRNVGS